MEKYFNQFYSVYKGVLLAKYPSLQVEYRIMLKKSDRANGTYTRQVQSQKAQFKHFAAIRNRILALSKLMARKRLPLEHPMKLKVLQGVRDVLGKTQSVGVQTDISYFNWKSKSVQVHGRSDRRQEKKVSTVSNPIKVDVIPSKSAEFIPSSDQETLAAVASSTNSCKQRVLRFLQHS